MDVTELFDRWLNLTPYFRLVTAALVGIIGGWLIDLSIELFDRTHVAVLRVAGVILGVFAFKLTDGGSNFVALGPFLTKVPPIYTTTMAVGFLTSFMSFRVAAHQFADPRRTPVGVDLGGNIKKFRLKTSLTEDYLFRRLRLMVMDDRTVERLIHYELEVKGAPDRLAAMKKAIERLEWDRMRHR